MKCLHDVIGRMSGAILLRTAGAAFGLFANLAIARALGASGAGVFFLALTLITAASVVARLGLDQVFLRHVAADVDGKDARRFAAIYRGGLMLSIVAGVSSTLLLFLGREPLADLFSMQDLGGVLSWMIWAIVPLGIGMLYGELLKGRGASNSALFLQAVLVPGILLCCVLLGLILSPSSAAIAFTMSNVLVLLLAYAVWRIRMRGSDFGPFAWDLRRTWFLSSPLLAVALTNFALSWADTLLLGYWGSSRDVGVYGMAMRLATMPSFFLVATASVIAPRLAALHAAGKRDEMEMLSRGSATAMTLLALPVLLVITLFPDWVLAFAGEEFKVGATVLVILTMAQFVIVVTGPGGFLLSMTGQQRILRDVSVMGAVLNVMLNAALIPLWGINGAAVATATSLIVMNLRLVVEARRHVGVNALPFVSLPRI